jgi:hypothetical protein
MAEQIADHFARNSQSTKPGLVEFRSRIGDFAGIAGRIAMAKLRQPDADPPLAWGYVDHPGAASLPVIAARSCAQNPISRTGEANPLLTVCDALASCSGSSPAR